MQKKILQSMIIASLFVVNSSQSSIVHAAIGGTNYSSCYSAGEKAFAVSDYVKAADNFAEALKYKPDDLRSHLKYAQSLYSLNKYDESSQHLKTVLQNSPNNIIARVYLAENYIQLGEKDSAKNQLEWILRVQPNHQRAKSLYESINNGIPFTNEKSISSNKSNDNKSNLTNESTKKVEFHNSYKEETTKNKPVELSLQNKETKKENTEKIKNTESVNLSLEKKENIKKDSTEIAKIDSEEISETTVAIENETISEKSDNVEIIETTDSTDANDTVNNEDTTDSSMTFTPYIASEKRNEALVNLNIKPRMPQAREDIKDTDLKSFFELAKNSFIVNLEKVRYEIECGDLINASKTIEMADRIARANKNNHSILEAQIFKSLIFIYNCDYKQFGKHLMTLKPVLSKESYQSFLDIYAKADALNSEDEQKRLSAGVAIGAGHYNVAASLLKSVFDKNPSDSSIYEMLLESQLNSLDYDGAEETLKNHVENKPESSEANFNLSKFYLTANYKPELARKYAETAIQLDQNDVRPQIIIALTDYSEGKIEDGINKIKSLMSNLEDGSMKSLCQKLISDGEKLSNDSETNFTTLVAMPGSKSADPSSLRFSAEDDLKAGSYFTALEKFKKADEKVEMGRVYLGLASALTSSSETEVAAIAAGYGMKLIKEDMARGKNIARASLYRALYYLELNDKDSAFASIDLGLNCKDLDVTTYNKLVALYEKLN